MASAPEEKLGLNTTMPNSVNGSPVKNDIVDPRLNTAMPNSARISKDMTTLLAEGHVNSVPANWIESSFDMSASGSPIKWTGKELVVRSQYGMFVFRPSSADVRVLGVQGAPRVLRSFFTVEAGGVFGTSAQAQPRIAGMTVSLEYGVFIDSEVWGKIAVSYDFGRSGPPKISASANPATASIPIRERFRLVWVLITPYSVIQEDPQTFTRSGMGESYLREGITRVWLGNLKWPDLWRPHLLVDWSGEVATATVGSFGSEGNAVIIRFPYQQASVDPFVVADPVDYQATGASTERKAFFTEGRVWVFYYDGDIKYRSGRVKEFDIVWDDAQVAISGPLSAPFDIANAGSRIALTWRDVSQKLFFRVGFLEGNRLYWSKPTQEIASDTEPKTPPSVSIASDGTCWVATGYPIWLTVYQIDKCDSLTATYGWATPSAAYPILLPLSEGRLMVVYSVSSSGEIYWCLWDTHKSANADWSPTGWHPADIDYTWGASALSAVGTDIISPGYVAYGHVVFRRASTGKIEYLRIRIDRNFQKGTVDTRSVLSPDGTQGAYPTVSRDINGDLHAVWVYDEGTVNHLYHARRAPGRAWEFPPWKPAEEFLYSSTVQRAHLTSSYMSQQSLFVVWREGSDPYSVQLAYLPLPSSSLAATPDPWSRPGLSQDGPFVAQGDEYIAVGTGRLVVRHSDINVRGRGLDLEISRLYVQPEVLAGYAPYGHDDYHCAPVGLGWRLNLPWITDTFVYWLDGQRYLIRWDKQVFENHQGAHFRLQRHPTQSGYLLTTPGGVQYTFQDDGCLTSVTDTFGNIITVNYAASKVSSIVDTIGRSYTFTYDPLAGGNLKTITYAGGKTVSYSYHTGPLGYSLASVTDQEGRVTQYGYAWSMSQYILNSVTYPSGGHTFYEFGSRLVGSDSWTHPVISQKVYTGPNPTDLVRKNNFIYEIVWGRVVFAKVLYFEGEYVLKGSTEYVFDGDTGSVDTRLLDPSGVLLRRTRSWYDPNGAVSYQETFFDEGVNPNFTTEVAFDNWGNPIYTRDPSGHETFATYSNTRDQNAFRTRGRLTRTSSGLYLHDDFSDRDYAGWVISGTGTVTIDKYVFSSAPPSVRLETVEPNRYVQMDRGIGDICSRPSAFIEYWVRPGEIADWQDVVVAGGGSARVKLRFGANQELQYATPPDGSGFSSFNPTISYKPGWWFRLGIWVYRNAANELTWDFWLNGVLYQSGISALYPYWYCGIDAVSFQVASSSQSAVRMWVNEVKAYASRQVTVNGLQPGQAVLLRSLDGVIRGQAKVPSGATSLTVTASPFFHELRLEVLGADLALDAESPFNEVWGGNERSVFSLTKSVLESVPGKVGRYPGTYEYILETGGRGLRVVISARTYELITVIPYYL